MEDDEKIESVRQQIMRFHELLGLMREKLEYGEAAYRQWFAAFSAEATAGMREKDLQWKLAVQMVEDTSPLRNAAGRMRFEARGLEQAFEELHDLTLTDADSE